MVLERNTLAMGMLPLESVKWRLIRPYNEKYTMENGTSRNNVAGAPLYNPLS